MGRAAYYTLKRDEPMNMWKCSVCGYVWDGDEAPDQCPKCGAPKEKFDQLSEEAAAKIERSRFTNSLHMSLYALLNNAIEIAQAGIEDALDPACVKIFEQVLQEARISQQRIKAELEGHMNKGKWG